MPNEYVNHCSPGIVELIGADELRHRLTGEARDDAREWQSGVIAGKLVGLHEQVIDRQSSIDAGVQPA